MGTTFLKTINRLLGKIIALIIMFYLQLQEWCFGRNLPYFREYCTTPIGARKNCITIFSEAFLICLCVFLYIKKIIIQKLPIEEY